MQEFFIQTESGNIHCCQWMPEGEAVGVVQIIHGISEYIARYDEMACWLAAQGFIVVGEDHPGHGHSVPEEENHGYLTGGWMATVKLIHQLYLQIHSKYPDLPYIMLGHSMGSFLLRTYLFTYRDPLAGAIISGTAWMPGPVISAGVLVCKEEAARLGERQHSKAIQKLMFGSYSNSFMPKRTPYDWVCSRKEIVDAYAKDPFCTWLPSIQLCREMMFGLQMIQKRSNLDRMQKNLPIWFFAGQQDPVGAMGNGVLKAVRVFKEIGMTDVGVELYPNMRHECHNEIGREKVYQDILNWIQQKCL